MMRAGRRRRCVSVTVVVVDPAPEADAALGFGSEPEVVEELVGEGAVEALSFAVGLGPVGPGPAVHDSPFGQDFGKRVGDEVGPVVGEDLVDGHVDLCGLELRSVSPASACSHQRRHHFATVPRDSPICRATWAWASPPRSGGPSTDAQRASSVH